MEFQNASSLTPPTYKFTDILNHNTPQLIVIVLATLSSILLATRLLTNRATQPQPTSQNGAKTVPAVPYWAPFLGHIPNMAINADSFVKGLRGRYNQGAFALNFFGTQHNIVYTPGLATALLNQKAEYANAEETVDSMLQTVFGMPKADLQRYYDSREGIMACYKYLLSEPSLSEMVTKTVGRLRENVVNLVSFADSPVDEMAWERNAKMKIVKNAKGEVVVEASLLPLIQDFCAHCAIPTLIGSDFLNNFPDFTSSLWKLDRGFLFLASGLPRWLPIPPLTRAHIARKKIIEDVSAFHRALEKHANGQDPGVNWRNLDDVGSLVKARLEVYQKDNWGIGGRAALEHSLLWAGNANSNVLVFWMMNRIYSDSGLLSRIRTEIAPYVIAVQRNQDLPIPEQIRLDSIDVDGLCEKCPLLKSCYIECLRIDTASWSLKMVKQDFVLQAREKDAQGWLLRRGEYAHAAHDLHNTDPAYFEDPLLWKADRHIHPGGSNDKRDTAEMGSIRPYGGGSSMCKGRSFAFKECMAFAATILALWDVEPKDSGEWKMPRHRKATGVYGTDDDIRIWVKRRNMAPSSS